MMIETLTVANAYRITVPCDCIRDYDTGICSFWISGSDTLLQLSGFVRTESKTAMPAGERLRNRLQRESLEIKLRVANLLGNVPDSAYVTFEDEEGVTWCYLYAVWPKLSLFITISGRGLDVEEEFGLLGEEDLWVRRALDSIELVESLSNDLQITMA